jgi:hypothetical protein
MSSRACFASQVTVGFTSSESFACWICGAATHFRFHMSSAMASSSCVLKVQRCPPRSEFLRCRQYITAGTWGAWLVCSRPARINSYNRVLQVVAACRQSGVPEGNSQMVELWQVVPLLYALGFTCCMIVLACREN